MNNSQQGSHDILDSLPDELYRPIFDNSSHLASVRGQPDAVYGGLLSNTTNKVSGQAKWEKVDVKKQISEALDRNKTRSGNGKLAVGIAVGVAGTALVTYIVYENWSQITRWWNESIVPFWNKLWGLSPARNRQSEPALSLSATINISPVMLSTALSEANEEYQTNMSSEEAQVHLLRVYLLAALIANELRQLAQTHINDNGTFSLDELQWRETLEKAVSTQFLSNVNSALSSPKLWSNPHVMVMLGRTQQDIAMDNMRLTDECNKHIYEALEFLTERANETQQE